MAVIKNLDAQIIGLRSKLAEARAELQVMESRAERAECDSISHFATAKAFERALQIVCSKGAEDKKPF